MAWPKLSPEALERRNAAIRATWDDPLLRAQQRRRLCEKLGLPPDHITKSEDYNKYYREYQRRWRARQSAREKGGSNADPA